MSNDTHAHTHNHGHSAEEATQIIASHDLRVTSQRVIVLEAMMREPNDVNANALFERLRKDHPKLGLATIYRTLSTLAEAGVLDRLHHGADGACFRYCEPGHHHHLTCRSCHAVVELRDCDLDAWARKIARKHGFSEVEHRMELDGLCRTCRDAAA